MNILSFVSSVKLMKTIRPLLNKSFDLNVFDP